MNKLFISLLILLNISAQATEFSLICSNIDSDIVLLLSRTPLNDFEGQLVIDREENSIFLKKGIMRRGKTEYRDHSHNGPYKINFTFDLEKRMGDITVKTQFNQVIYRELDLTCE